MLDYDRKLIISCEEYANIRKKKLKYEIKNFSRKPRLLVIQIDNDFLSDSYINEIKDDCEELGVHFIHTKVKSLTYSQYALEKLIREFSYSNGIDGIILRLPKSHEYDLKKLRSCITPSKDIEGFASNSHFRNCVSKGIIDWFHYNNYTLVGKRIVIVGKNDNISKSLVDSFIKENATVTYCNNKTKYLFDHTSRAEVVVSAIDIQKWFNNAYFNNPDFIIDVGFNENAENNICGDVDKEDIELHCLNTYITPVPNGVDLLARLVLMDNTVQAYKKIGD